MKKALLLFLVSLPMFISAQSRLQIDSINAIDRLWIFSHIEESIPLFRENAQAARALDYSIGAARANTNLGLALYLKGKYAESVDAYLNAIRIFEAANSISDLVTTYGDLGYQMKRRDLKGGKRYMLKALRLAEQHQLTNHLSGLYDNYGVLQELDSRFDSAAYYYNKALALKREARDTLGIPYTLNHLAGLSMLKEDYPKARGYLLESDWYQGKKSGIFERLTNLTLWGDLFYQMGQLDSAAAMYGKVIETPEAYEQNYQVTYCFDQLADIYQRKGDYQRAYENLKRYQEFQDSLMNVQTNAKIAQLQIEYETEKKDRELAQRQLKINHRNTLLIISGLVVLLLLVVSFGIYKFQHQEIQRINRQMELEDRIKQSQYQQKISAEKERISRELHDNIGSNLTFLISSLDNLTYLVKDAVILGKLKHLSTFGRETINELRHTVWAMRIKETSLNTLVNKLQEIKLRFQQSFESVTITIENRLTEDVPFSSLQMINLFRVIQEAIQNALKYSGCREIKILFEEKAGDLHIQVRDDGSGFDLCQVKPGRGLENMKHRCEEAGGTFTLKSGPEGTEITCSLPEN